MIPSYPTVTQSNHYALVTGLYPGHSGIVGNSFYDPASGMMYAKGELEKFDKESIWETASKQNVISANINWVNGKKIAEGLQDVYQAKKALAKVTEYTAADHIAQINEWLKLPEDKRPHLITLYFYDADHAGHQFGPDSPETAQAVKEVDEAIGKIVAAVKETGLPVNFIFVSDHGMTSVDTKHPLKIPAVIDTAKFVVNNQNAIVNIHAKDKTAIPLVYKKLKEGANGAYEVYLNKDIPEHLHFGGKDDKYNRVGDIILVPVWPNTFNRKPGPGMHGFDFQLRQDMGATFIAWGPAFKKGITIKPFENVEVYDLMTTMLGLKPAPNDGRGELARQVLNKK